LSPLIGRNQHRNIGTTHPQLLASESTTTNLMTQRIPTINTILIAAIEHRVMFF
jgi:hypothetical protein